MNRLLYRRFFGIAIMFGTVSCGNSNNPSIETKDSTTTAVTPVASELVEPHGYLVANYSIQDKNVFQQYIDSSVSIIAQYNGKVILHDESTHTLEGSPKKVIDITEFPSVAAAEKFYHSSEYAAAKELRRLSTKGGWVLLASSPATTTLNKPHGYQVVNYTINDTATFHKYMDGAGPLAPKFGGTVPIFDLNAKALEGNPGKVFGVAEFAGLADADRFYHSPEYTAAKRFRIASTENGITILASSVPLQ